MSIGLKLAVRSQVVAKKFRLPRALLVDFELYVEAAREQEPAVDQNAIIQAILEHHFAKDRPFQEWLRHRATNSSSKTPGAPASPRASATSDDTSPGQRPPVQIGKAAVL